MRDVVVVGGGIAGAATALRLAQLGHDVVIVDRATFPRDKVCGEGLMPHGVEELRALGVADALTPRPFEGIRYRAGDDVAIGRFSEGPGWGLRRLGLDEVVLAAARAAGVEVEEGVRVSAIAVDAGGVAVTTDAGDLRARVVVGADGLHSLVRKQICAQLSATTAPRYGARLHVRLAPGRRAPTTVDVTLADGVEYYVTPVDDDAVNLALLCGKDTTRTLGGDLDANLWALLRAAPELRDWTEGATPISAAALTGPLRQSVSRLVGDRAVLVGDAAGFVDAITGEGMSLAMASARFAAETLHTGLTSNRLDVRALTPYAAARRRHARDQLAFTELVLWWIRQPRLRGRVVRFLARRPDVFDRMLEVNTGRRSPWQIPPRDLLGLALGW
jgi:geranylgeranyl reductase family protein